MLLGDPVDYEDIQVADYIQPYCYSEAKYIPKKFIDKEECCKAARLTTVSAAWYMLDGSGMNCIFANFMREIAGELPLHHR